MSQSNTGNAKIQDFMGEALNPPIEYTYSYDTFATKEEAIAAGKWLTDSDVLVHVNKKQETAAKANAYQAALKTKREAYEKSDAYKLKQLVSSLVANGMDTAEAEQMAQAIQAKNKS